MLSGNPTLSDAGLLILQLNVVEKKQGGAFQYFCSKMHETVLNAAL